MNNEATNEGRKEATNEGRKQATNTTKRTSFVRHSDNKSGFARTTNEERIRQSVVTVDTHSHGHCPLPTAHSHGHCPLPAQSLTHSLTATVTHRHSDFQIEFIDDDFDVHAL